MKFFNKSKGIAFIASVAVFAVVLASVVAAVGWIGASGLASSNLDTMTSSSGVDATISLTAVSSGKVESGTAVSSKTLLNSETNSKESSDKTSDSGPRNKIIPAGKNDKKVYCTATLKDDFADDVVTVVINKSNSAINKVWYKNDFVGVSVAEIKDLSYITGDVSSKEYLDYNAFKQIIALKLVKTGKDEVLKAIKILEQVPFIESAEPDYFYKID